MSLLRWFFLFQLACSACGRVAPSVPYRKRVNESYLKLQADNKILLPLPLADEGIGSGYDPENDIADILYRKFRNAVDLLQSLAYDYVAEIKFENCCEPKLLGFNKSRIYPVMALAPLVKIAYCDMETDGGGWTLILRRGFRKTKYQDVFPTIAEPYYHRGFGRVDRDFWLGLKALHYMTSKEDVELRVDLKHNGVRYFAKYSYFSIGNKSTDYTLQVDGYMEESTLPDSLSHSSGFGFVDEFSEPDSDAVSLQYDRRSRKCSTIHNSPWWYGQKGNETCSRVLFFGRFIVEARNFPKWEFEGEKRGFQFVEMKIRSKKWECGVEKYSSAEIDRYLLHDKYPLEIEEL